MTVVVVIKPVVSTMTRTHLSCSLKRTYTYSYRKNLLPKSWLVLSSVDRDSLKNRHQRVKSYQGKSHLQF